MTRSICVFTGTRAEYGLLRPVLKKLPSAGFDVRLLVSGTHLSKAFGMTANDIVADGLRIDEAVDVPLESNSPTGICAAMGAGLARFGEALGRLKSDALMILGDRYEAFAAAAAATVHGLPIIHLHGGEVTEGAIDDSFRHSITKMAHLHFASTEAYRQRIIQLGEDPAYVHNVGALGVENALELPLADPTSVESDLGLGPGQRYFLATFHPATRDEMPAEEQIMPLLEALNEFPDHVTVFTGANADAGGASINALLQARCLRQPDRLRFFISLGSVRYLSAARFADLVIGNSSSGIIEVPSLGVPSIDIGTRQAGRVRSDSVITCVLERDSIVRAIRTGLSDDFRSASRSAQNPYAGRDTASTIVRTLETTPFAQLVQKRFFDQKLTS